MTQSLPSHVALAVPCMAACLLWAQVSPLINVSKWSWVPLNHARLVLL